MRQHYYGEAFKKAQEALSNRKFKWAKKYLELAVEEEEDSSALYNLAMLHASGSLETIDVNATLRYLIRARQVENFGASSIIDLLESVTDYENDLYALYKKFLSPVKYSKEYGSFGQYRVPPPLFIFLFCAYFNFLTKTLNVEKEAIYAELDSLSMTATPAVYNFLQQTQIPFKDFFGSLEGSYFAKKDSQNLRQLNKILHDFHVRCLSYFGGAPGSVEFMRCTLAAVLINSSDCGFKRIPVLGAKEFFKRRNIAEIKTQYSALITQTASGSVDCTEGERSVAVFGTKIDRNFFENDVNIAKRVIARVSLTLLERLKTPSGTYQFIVTEFEALSNLFDPKSQKTTAEPHALSYENVYCVSEEFDAEFFRQYPPIEMFPIEFYGKNERVDKRNPLSKYLGVFGFYGGKELINHPSPNS